MVEVKVVNKSNNELPGYSTMSSAGMDLRAWLESEVVIKPMERRLIGTGLFIELPAGYEAQVRPRSGLALKHGITVLNTPGTIDADYRGEIGIILINLSDIDFTIRNGERIGQLIVSQFEQVNWKAVMQLESSERGKGGFGSTGHS